MEHEFNSLKGKTCLITGASQGLGRHFCYVLAEAGATIVATSLKSELKLLDDLVADITKKGGKAIALDLDVREYSSFTNKIEKILEQTKQIDVLVNNAGISYYTKFFDIREQDWDAHQNINLKGAFF